MFIYKEQYRAIAVGSFFSNIDKTDKLLADLRKKRADSQR